MTELVHVTEGVHTLESSLRLAPGFHLPVRATLLGLAGGGLVLVSPLSMDDALAAKVNALGRVEHIIAPNNLHHLFAGEAAARWPSARVHVAAGLPKKRPDLRADHTLPSAALPDELEAIPIEGAPALGETALYHHPSRTLVVTDLVFHVLAPRGPVTGLVLRLVGAHGVLAQSRALRTMFRDRRAAAESLRRVLALDFTRLIMAHGEIVEQDAHARLERALLPILGGAQARASK